MSFPIKFRVWDKHLGKFIPFNSIPCHNFESNDLVYQQFINAKDENGRDIYEGDFLSGRENPILVKRGLAGYDFIYKCNHAFFNYFDVAWADFSGGVIGNIFENPEMLEAHKRCLQDFEVEQGIGHALGRALNKNEN